jgi:hypothetical protein
LGVGLLVIILSPESPAQPPEQEEMHNGGDAKRRPPISVDVLGNQLVVTSEDPQALRRVSELVRLLTSSPSDFEVIRLKHAKAAEAAKFLNERFNGPKAANPAPGKGGDANGPGGRLPGKGSAGAPPPAPPEERIRIVADPATNSLMVMASPLDLIAIRGMVEKKLDAEIAPANAGPKAHPRIPLKNMYANDAYIIVRDILREDHAADTDGDGASQGVAVSITYDKKSNSLIVACPAPLYEDIKNLIERVDTAVGDRKSDLLYFQREDRPPTVSAKITVRDEMDLDARPLVYRPGKLPNELPAWFTDLDTNNDGQISLPEWRKAGKSIAEFQQWDRNNDGFITPSEALAKQRVLNKVAGIGNFNGFLDPAGTRDPVRGTPCQVYNMRMTQGKTYVIDLKSRQFDSFLRLEDSGSRQLAQDDDSGGNLDARITFRCQRSGTYRVFATSMGGNARGAYTLSIREK